MDRSDFCGCKGVRTCIKCEEKFGYENKNTLEFTEHTYVYCPYCNKAWQGSEVNSYKTHPKHEGKSFSIDGIYIKEDFLSQAEASTLINDLDALSWDKSQSGRRKQNFGPKCNFKKQKIKLGDFQGFPMCTKFIQDRFKEEDQASVLGDFQTIEQCSLEYDSIHGSSIDYHVDDCWIWGERIVTVNVIGDSVLTLKYYEGDDKKYNLHSNCYKYSKKYSTNNNNKIVKDAANSADTTLTDNDENKDPKSKEITADSSESLHAANTVTDAAALGTVLIRVPMPARSLLVLSSEARYEWEHCIPRNDIAGRRVCIAYREFTSPYLSHESTRCIFEKARCFF